MILGHTWQWWLWGSQLALGAFSAWALCRCRTGFPWLESLIVCTVGIDAAQFIARILIGFRPAARIWWLELALESALLAGALAESRRRARPVFAFLLAWFFAIAASQFCIPFPHAGTAINSANLAAYLTVSAAAFARMTSKVVK